MGALFQVRFRHDQPDHSLVRVIIQNQNQNLGNPKTSFHDDQGLILDWWHLRPCRGEQRTELHFLSSIHLYDEAITEQLQAHFAVNTEDFKATVPATCHCCLENQFHARANILHTERTRCLFQQQ
ncbi:hypothetical protein L798_13200 [Zootermopsis nevadensis]|uniref:Uncharacterized protein n=1 Tax=Zootermopsis nevadensis TaxID=136037 RepID=A0A067QTD5_ZOONE|nr:hypothetical protein L798_13200 [Zootermopsis nevadensis]